MYWAVSIGPIASGEEYPTVHGPFLTSEEQKAFIRAQRAAGVKAFFLDVDVTGRPHMGRVTKVDGGNELA